jgi:hypothetical protein
MTDQEIVDALRAVKKNIVAIDCQVRELLPLMAGRLQISGNIMGQAYDYKKSLTSMKRELRNWDIARERWIKPV